jgi:RNA polymerase sigma-70 factor, ECF subfamily
MKKSSILDACALDDSTAEAPREKPRFEDVYAGHARDIFNYLCFQTGDPAAADDLLSAVFERVYRGLERFDPRRGPLRPWLYTIVRNCLRNSRRRPRPRASFPVERLPSLEPGPEEQTLSRDGQHELAAAVSRLSRRDREVIGLKFSGGLSNGSIARVMGLREGNVAVILHRAIRRLSEMLREGGTQ